MTKSFLATALALFLTIPATFAQGDQQITLEDIWRKGTFSSAPFRVVRSMKDGVHYSKLDSEDDQQLINKYSYKTGKKVETLVKGKDLVPKGANEPIEIESYSFSADESKLLIATETERIYRHSTREVNYVYDLNTKQLQLLSNGKQRYATFSPAGDKVAFVRENNLHYKDLKSGKEKAITRNGDEGSIINGATDWVYEEEFGFDKGFFWSPDGNKIAFYVFNEREVPDYSMTIYGELYPEQESFKYPKAGEQNSKVNILIYSLEADDAVAADLPKREYIPRIKWTQDPNLLSVQTMNRHQNDLKLVLVNAKDGSHKPLISETSDTYIDITDNLTFLEDGQHFIWTSEKDGYNHIYLYGMDGKPVRQITKGKWDVLEYLGFNESSQSIFYQAAEVSPMERQVYSIGIKGGKKTLLSEANGSNRAIFSSSFKYFINFHSNANTPNTITLRNEKGKVIRELEANDELRIALKKYQISPLEFLTIPTKDAGELNAWMIKPADFDPSKKYPVLMYVYGGPGAQTVLDRWGGSNYIWYQLLAQNGYIVVSVDNRGTGARGRDFKNCTYKQLGKLETEDQITAAKWLQTQSFVDANRIGIWGWSYGGYMSSLCLTKGANVFKMAIAVAPVTNWRYYDTIYTERYMQTPDENPDGYDDNSPINHVDKMEGAYLLVHGMADDNVHFQNAVEMSEALIRADKQFDYLAYPNRNHGIYGNNARMHLYTKMTAFIFENL